MLCMGLLTAFWSMLLLGLRRHFLSFWFLALPGVILHELTHWVVALLTNGNPGMPNFIPKKIGDYYVLGRVSVYHARWYNALFIGLAPLILIPAAVALIYYGCSPAFLNLQDWRYLIIPLLSAECLIVSLPSRADLRLALLSWLPVLILILLLGIVLSG